MSESCSVCMDEFNKSTRARTECPHCHVGICRTCLQTYILQDISDTSRCVNVECSQGWSREFLDGEFTRSFRLTTYKDHREKVLADREKARLPGTQTDAATYKTASAIYAQTQAELAELTKQARKLGELMHIKEQTLLRARGAYVSHGRYPLQQGGEATKPKAENAIFIKPCPASECKGFLSTAWKCGLCELWTCPDCHDVKGAVRDGEHTCDPAKVATAALLAREAKNCPKCGVPICKQEGCDQMWCTACNTGFNWRTGKIADGPIHNPHYFDWLRRQGRDPATLAGGQPLTCEQDLDRRIVQALGGRGNYYGQYRFRPRSRESADTDDNYLLEVWRLRAEAADAYNREPNADEAYRKLRVQFMVGEITEEVWKVSLQKIEKDVNFSQAKRQVGELFAGASHDLIRGILEPEANKKEIRRQVDELIQYCNDSYGALTKRFGRKTPTIQVRLEVSVPLPASLPTPPTLRIAPTNA